MNSIFIFLLALGLCFDSFAVSLSAAMGCGVWQRGRAVRFAGVLALMQGLMPVVGWLLAFEFAHLISAWDHWVAFGLLLLLGGKMIWGAIGEWDAPKEERGADPFLWKNSLILGVATSIDALATGVALAFTQILMVEASQFVNLWVAAGIIGLVTFGASLTGLWLGRRSRGRLGGWSEVLGGVILIGIGVKVLVEHLG